MKIIYYFFCVTLLVFIGGVTSSCSSDAGDFFNEENSSVNLTNDSLDIITIDSLFSIGNEAFKNWKSSPCGVVTRSTVLTPITIHGYSSMSSSGSRRANPGSELALKLGIPNQTYVIESFTCYQDIIIQGLNSTVYFIAEDSPNCGIDPNNSSHIGYANSINGNSVRMVTKVHHIISDLSGISYNLYYPRNPNDLEWQYSLLTR